MSHRPLGGARGGDCGLAMNGLKSRCCLASGFFDRYTSFEIDGFAKILGFVGERCSPMCIMRCLALLLAVAAASAGPARAATCPFISDRDLAGAMPGAKWSLISNQDG